ncbi:MAG: hypothetical protein JSS91_08440 [Bacteroidetes bacterium]|nr:hypothetical protein [Bacteroidota bacterium]
MDFYCAERILAIEIDGDIHDDINSLKLDKERKDFFIMFGKKIFKIKK